MATAIKLSSRALCSSAACMLGSPESDVLVSQENLRNMGLFMPPGAAEFLTGVGPSAVAAAIGAVSVTVGAAIWLTRMVLEAKIERLQAEIDRVRGAAEEDAKRLRSNAKEEVDRAAKRYAELDEQYAALTTKYEAMLNYGPNVQLRLDEIAAEVARVALILGAERCSVLVPAPTIIAGEQPKQLVFLYASGTQAETLRWVRVPMTKSFSGEAFLKGKTLIGRKTIEGHYYASSTDSATQTTTEETLSVCLLYRSEPVAVAQFVNKQVDHFTMVDADKATEECRMLTLKVRDFLSDPKRIIDLGHVPRQPDINVTVMFIDLTGFSNLFSVMDSSVIIERLNQYLHDACRIATTRGALVDKFTGDGVMLVFNAQQTTPDHAALAVETALDIRSAFRALRARWVKLQERPLEHLFIRMGLSSGDVTPAEVGPPRNRDNTFVGVAVNAAAKACAAAPRDRDTICVKADSPPVGTWRATELSGENRRLWEIEA